mmetsp:Transcript_18484/g.29428  ORF Transcript_18484/g.29428 Transcript_18484/m.29428 type:complete len:218 (-) Transcript_18484:3564-4217(-)
MMPPCRRRGSAVLSRCRSPQPRETRMSRRSWVHRDLAKWSCSRWSLSTCRTPHSTPQGACHRSRSRAPRNKTIRVAPMQRFRRSGASCRTLMPRATPRAAPRSPAPLRTLGVRSPGSSRAPNLSLPRSVCLTVHRARPSPGASTSGPARTCPATSPPSTRSSTSSTTASSGPSRRRRPRPTRRLAPRPQPRPGPLARRMCSRSMTRTHWSRQRRRRD